MGPPFYAGFLVAWTIVYIAASSYCTWASRRPLQDGGAALLGAFFGALALAAGATAAAMLSTDSSSVILARVGHAATMPAPILLVQFAGSGDKSRSFKMLVTTGHAIAGVLALASLAGSLDAAAHGFAGLGIPSRLGQISAVLLAATVLGASYFVGRSRSRTTQLGLGPFLGACGLSVAAVYDAGTALAEAPRPPLILAGFAVFTLSLFIGQIVRLARRRERLVAKTAELSRKSKSLAKSFRELRARQDELVRKEQLAAIGELSAVIAHEVRNPLAIMSNAVATLRRDPDTEARDTLLGILSEEGARLNQLVGDLLHYAKPLALERQSVTLYDLVKKAIQPVDAKPNILLRVSQDRNLPKVGGDPLLLRQVIDNVVNNALQAMSAEGGTLTVELTKTSDGGSGVALLVRDTGEGMDTVVRKRALDPFFTTRPSGTGLGLAIVARVVEAHGGRLTIRSELGAGTEVTIFLPSYAEKEPARLGQRLLPIVEPFESAEARDGSAPRKREAS